MPRGSAVGVLLVALVAPAAAADNKLERKFKEGDTFFVENVTKTKQSLGAGASRTKPRRLRPRWPATR